MPMRSVSIYAILLFLSCSFSSMHLCASRNSLVPGKPLSPGNTLVSDDGTFALGFFSPSKSTKKHYYLSIWYNNIPQRTVVWVANRAAPISDLLSAMLALHSSTNLVLSDANGRVLWNSNNSIAISASPATTVSAEATLENTGNFILLSNVNRTTLWQSFDHPSDTLLPGMKLRISHKMHPIQHLISWNGLQDPSPGVFYGADPNSIQQQFIWNGTRPHRRSPVWTSYFLLGGYMDNLHSTIYMAVHCGTDDDVYMSISMPIDSLSFLIRMEINYSGNVNILSWDSNMSVWTSLYIQPAHKCNEYDYCGPYGYCDNNGTAPTCKCLDGFEPNDDEGWVSTGISFHECAAECWSNCSCVAYAHANMSTKGINGDDTRCLIWTGKMIDMERYSQGGETLYIRIDKSSGDMTKTKTLEIALPAVTSFLVFICIGVICTYWFRDKQGSTDIRNRLMLGDMSTANEVAGESVELSLYSFREISTATNNFADSTILGQGGFGTVYKGTLGDKEIAVKRLCKDSAQGAVEFKNELALIARLQHRNLVKLLGHCLHANEKLLIYEYLPNKSLHVFLFSAARKSLLDWPTRFMIRTLFDSTLDSQEFQCQRTTIKYHSGRWNIVSDFIREAWRLWKDGNMQNLVDPSIVESCSLGESLRCIHIGLLLVQDNPNAGPLMPWVVSSLDNEGIELPQPREPVYFARRHSETGGAGAGQSNISDMSLGTLEGR
ncbi:unnamed protein product [Miscanthus lutarioriparius]|uniref:Receptor-like serine/threonine-protein kinase n=1 Tax=Miscanthus lutarioriparius TaxID=422564 RepID=A0A811R7K0_9POAL|nr:unnamed protein product [Miscanthus lutarioriparius]